MMPTPPDRATAIWRKRLAAALRIAAACAIVGCSTLYGPSSLRHQVPFPAFSYLTAILMVSEATLGDTLRGTWHALIGTLMAVGPSIATLWLVGPGRFTPYSAALAVAVGAFAVAVADSAPILSKRIAFGQMVIVYVGAVVLGAETAVVMHPLHVAASTAVGALASVLAMLLPFPRMAACMMKNKLKSYGENASWRLKLVTKALADEDGSNEATDPLPLIKSSSRQASKLLLCIKRYQDAMPWERPKLWISPAPDAETLQQVEMSLRGMEMALASHLSQRENDTMSEQLKDELRRAADRPCSRIEQIKNSSLFESSKVDGAIDTSCATLRDLSVLFFLQCMNLLNEGSRFGQEGVGKRMRILCGLLPKVRRQNVLFAVKCSLSLGLAVLLGLTYTKQNAYWSGLTIAISFATRRQATFSATNARAQGTALGTVYGALAYFVCHRFELLKLASLLPWIIFTTFLRHSEMYGETGSISATVAALLILGRKDYGTPTDFAVARLVESFIGLSCLILVEILICPERAAVLVKMRASHTFRDLNLLFGDIVAEIDDTGSNSSTSSLVDKKKGMRIQVDALKRLIEEAREEPSFWFKPFPDDCYTRLLECVQRMADVLYLMAYSVDALKLEVKKPEINIGLFKRVLSAAFGSVEEVMRTNKYNGRDQKPQFKESSFNDIEAGDEEASTILDSFLQNAQDLIECREVMADPKHKKRMLVSIGSLAFCMQSLVADTTEARRIVGELNLRESL